MKAIGDRFISQRSCEDDAATLFGTKMELFAAASNSPAKRSNDANMNSEDGQ